MITVKKQKMKKLLGIVNILKKKYWILLIVIILIILVTTIRFNVFNSTDILFKKLPVKAQVLLRFILSAQYQIQEE